MAVGVATLQYVLEEGSRNDWFESTAVAVCDGGALLLSAFVIRELTATAPVVNLSLFKDNVSFRDVDRVVMFAMLMSMFLLPVFMQELLGFTAMQSGIALMPRTLAMMFASRSSAGSTTRCSRASSSLGVVLFAISAYMMRHFTLETGGDMSCGSLGVALRCCSCR